MGVPSQVASSAIQVCEVSFTVPGAGAGATAMATSTITISNTSSGNAGVDLWLVLDVEQSYASEADSVPLTFVPGTTRQDMNTLLTGLSAGQHTLSLYANSTVTVSVVWSRIMGFMFLA